jgi:hypothetical protein
MAEPVQEVEVEYAGKEKRAPDRHGASAADDPLFAWIARLMDTAFTIPGTNIRFGLDPIIGLFPGFGDLAAALVSVALISRCVRYGVPRIVLARMGLNVVINAMVGEIPIVGDLFSVWFKSNQKNYELLQKHAGQLRTSTRKDWIFVIGLIGGVLAILALTFLGALWLLKKLWVMLPS